jgi:Polysaccharide lyase/CARDB
MAAGSTTASPTQSRPVTMSIRQTRTLARTFASALLLLSACVLFATTCVSAAGSSRTRARADLVIVRIAVRSSSTAPGHTFVTEVVRNAGKRRAPASATRFYLSLDRKRSRHDVRLLGRHRVRPLGPRRRVRGRAEVTAPRRTPPGRYFLLGCADDRRSVSEANERNNCRPSSVPISLNPGGVFVLVPAPTITSTPSERTAARNATFGFEAAKPAASFRCRLDGDPFRTCASPQHFAGPLANGTHTFEVMARDMLGNESSVTRATWTIAWSPPPVVPPVWSADMETGNLGQWTLRSTLGGSYDSGRCSRPPNGVSTDVAHSGRYSMKMTIDTANRTESGCRQFRHAESVSGNTYYYGAWYYLPARYDGIDYWNVFQFKSETSSRNDPFWVLDLMPRSDGALHLKLRWKGTVVGPYASATSTGTKYYDQNALTVPVRRWFHVEAHLKQASDYSGRLTIWQDGTQLYDMVNVKTKYPGGDQRWSVNNYSDGVSPNPTSLYLDDATVATARVGP